MLSIPARGRRVASVAVRARRISIRFAFFLADALAFAFAFVLASDLRQLAAMTDSQASLAAWMGRSIPSHFVCYLVAVCVTVFFLWERGLYRKRFPVWEELRILVRLVFSGAVIEVALLFLLSEAPVDKQAVLLTWAIALVLVPSVRLTLKSALIVLGVWMIPAVIIGDGKNATTTYRALKNDRLLGYKVKAFLGGPAVGSLNARITIGKNTIPVLPLGEDAFQVLRQLGNPSVILALDSFAEAEAAFSRFRALGNLVVIPPIRGLPLHGMEISHFFGEEILIMRVRNNLDSWWARILKRTVDIALSSFLLILLSPLFALVALMILREDGGPVFFMQKRVGRGGREFAFLKFRSMIKEAEEVLRAWETTQPGLLNAYRNNNFKLEKDPRVSRTGKWIRRTSIDELPQLLNVIAGEMSLIGPRPLLARELPDYGVEIELYKQVRPGITGLWQVSGRSATLFSDRARLDAWYVRNWSLWYDMVILAKTVRAVLARDGAY